MARASGSKLIPFVWSTDRSKSFESFYECYESWHNKSMEDDSINLNEMFPTLEFDSEDDRRKRRGKRRRS